MSEFSMDQIRQRMNGALEALTRELNGLRTNRASTHLLDPIMVEAYDGKMPLSQVGTVSTPEARLLTVSVWDKGLVKNVEKAIRDAGLGLNPMADGTTIRIPMPELSQERRQELVKVAGKYVEQGRIAVRNVRRDGMEVLKKLEKDGDMSEDDARRHSEELQKVTDEFVKKMDQALQAKEKDILQV